LGGLLVLAVADHVDLRVHTPASSADHPTPAHPAFGEVAHPGVIVAFATPSDRTIKPISSFARLDCLAQARQLRRRQTVHGPAGVGPKWIVTEANRTMMPIVGTRHAPRGEIEVAPEPSCSSALRRSIHASSGSRTMRRIRATSASSPSTPACANRLQCKRPIHGHKIFQ
jgi:hypothetical protein